MVITRSGASVRRHAVRFKKGDAVRKVLEYDENDWEFNGSSPSLTPEPEKRKEEIVLMNGGTAHTQYSHSVSSPTITDSLNTTIVYDINERPHRSWIWDAILFVVITLLGYSALNTVYNSWGYELYLLFTTLFVVTFSYNITYFDSSKPGVLPPSPISPAVYRRMSGHTYHLTYLMSVINGIVFLVVEPYIRNAIIPPI